MNVARTIRCTWRQSLGPWLCTLPVLGLLFPTAAMGDCDLYVDGVRRISGTLTSDCVEVNTNGCLIIESTGTLILNGDPGTTSTVDGCIILEGAGSTLSFTSKSHAVVGSGVIDGQDSSAVISIASGITMTSSLSTIGITGRLAITGTGSFVNQGKVYANDASGTLTISVAGVDDTDNGGTVSSTNFRWGVNASGAKLLFSVEPAAMAGDFYVHAGTLQVGVDPIGGDDIDVCTTGDTLFEGGRITTGLDDSFSCSGSCS